MAVRSHELEISLVKGRLVSLQIDLMPHDVITQLLRVLAIETKQEKAIINAEPADVALSGLEAFSFDYIVKWPLSLIINRFLFALMPPPLRLQQISKIRIHLQSC